MWTLAFKVNDRVALRNDVEKGKTSFYRIKKVKDNNTFVLGKCSCRPDLYFDATEEDVYTYEEAKKILTKTTFN